jgi:hypothetical protein
MTPLLERRRGPFLVAAAVVLIVTILVFRLPESLVDQLRRHRPLSTDQSGWATKLLAMAAIAQAAYGGFVILATERVRRARENEARVSEMSKAEIVTSVARNAAAMVVLTLVYGIAAFLPTGERGSFWLFVLVAVAQGAWYFRQVGEIARWLVLQPEHIVRAESRGWKREPPDYSPPLARAARPMESGRGSS